MEEKLDIIRQIARAKSPYTGRKFIRVTPRLNTESADRITDK